MEIKYHTKKDGAIKYYATYRTAWEGAIRLNKKVEWQHGSWWFEGNAIGWYLYFVGGEA